VKLSATPSIQEMLLLFPAVEVCFFPPKAIFQNIALAKFLLEQFFLKFYMKKNENAALMWLYFKAWKFEFTFSKTWSFLSSFLYVEISNT